MANWVFPLQEPDGQDQRLHLNGTGQRPVPLAVAVSLLKEQGLTKVVWPEQVADAEAT